MPVVAIMHAHCAGLGCTYIITTPDAARSYIKHHLTFGSDCEEWAFNPRYAKIALNFDDWA
jgi:hypothetical protein